MIFENNILSLAILDVISLEQGQVNSQNGGRNFDAVSFRVRSDALLEANGRSIRATGGSLCYVPAHLDYKRSATVDELIVIHFRAADYVGREIELFVPDNAEELRRLFESALEIWNAKESGYMYRATACLYQIFAECNKNLEPIARQKSKIHDAVEYMLENYKNPDLTVSEIAKRSFMSEVYFRRLFKLEFGISPQKYIIDLRMRHAQMLMSTGYYSLSEAAYASGYTDYKYFSSEFKRRNGISPSKYFYDF